MFTKLILTTALGLTFIAGLSAQKHKTMKSINENAPVKCKKAISIHANSKKIWAVLTNIDRWSEWQTEITRSKLNGELKPNTTFDWKSGGAKIHSILHSVEPNKYLGWTGKTFGMYAVHNWTLIENNGITTISVEESMEGLLAKLFKRTFNKSLEKGMQTWLTLLKEECEK
jgi:uncharacterized protein YndB with AHSA1/START domain